MVSESRRKEKRVHAPAEAAGWPQGQAPDEELMFPGGRVHGHSDRAETGLLGPDEPGNIPYNNGDHTIYYHLFKRPARTRRTAPGCTKTIRLSSLPGYFGLGCIQLPSWEAIRLKEVSCHLF